MNVDIAAAITVHESAISYVESNPQHPEYSLLPKWRAKLAALKAAHEVTP